MELLHIIALAVCCVCTGFCLGAWFVTRQTAMQVKTMIQKMNNYREFFTGAINGYKDRINAMRKELETLKSKLRGYNDNRV